MPRHWYDLRVFTRDGEGGNPLAVVPDAVEIPTETLQKGAAEIGYPETVYLDWTHEEAVPKVRIFTPAAELPFAGHPLVGTVWLLERVGPMKGFTHIEPPVGRLRCGADAEGAWVACPQAPVGECPDLTEALSAIGLPHSAGPPVAVGVGQHWYLVEAQSAADIAALQPDFAALGVTPGGDGTCVWWVDGTTARVRFFAPTRGVPEDAATGSAAVALATLLGADGRLPSDVTLEILQGDEVGRPSRISVTRADGAITLAGTVAMEAVRHLSI